MHSLFAGEIFLKQPKTYIANKFLEKNTDESLKSQVKALKILLDYAQKLKQEEQPPKGRSA